MKWWLLAVIFTGILIFAVPLWVYFKYFAAPLVIRDGRDIPLEEAVSSLAVAADPLRDIYLLLLGYGGGTHAGGTLADTIIVAQILPRQKKVNLFSLPRDLWITLPFTIQANATTPWSSKLNSTYAIGSSTHYYLHRPAQYQGNDGGGTLAKQVVGEIVGQPIDYFMAVDFSGFKKIITIIAGEAGLKVNVPYSFRDDHYPLTGEENNSCGLPEEEIAALSATMSGDLLEQQFPCRFETLVFQAGPQMISPEQLLKFVRSRHSGIGGGDFGRSQRQQVVLEALKDKLFSLSLLPKLSELTGQVLQTVHTDLDVPMLKKALLDYQDLNEFTLESHVLGLQKDLVKQSRSPDGQAIVLPLAGQDEYQAIHQWIITTRDATTSATRIN